MDVGLKKRVLVMDFSIISLEYTINESITPSQRDLVPYPNCTYFVLYVQYIFIDMSDRPSYHPQDSLPISSDRSSLPQSSLLSTFANPSPHPPIRFGFATFVPANEARTSRNRLEKCPKGLVCWTLDFGRVALHTKYTIPYTVPAPLSVHGWCWPLF